MYDIYAFSQVAAVWTYVCVLSQQPPSTKPLFHIMRRGKEGQI